MQLGGHDSFWADWTNVEWVLGGIIAVVVPIGTFVYRLSIKVMLLEHMIKENDKDENHRHAENVHLQHGVQMRLDALSNRIDRVFGRSPGDDRGARG